MKKFIYWLLGLGLVVLMMLFIMGMNLIIEITPYEIKDRRITEDITIAFISDLHGCDYGEDLMDRIYAINPDVVLLGGDMVDEKMSTYWSYHYITMLKLDYPVYFVSGNHEYWTKDIENIKKKIRKLGATVLEGTCFDLKGVNVCGIDDYIESKDDQLSKITLDDAKFNILLTHRPSYIEDYLKYNYDLVLAGHAHGGQWRIPGLLNGLVAPDEWLFPKYAAGLYNVNNSKMIVNRGLAKENTFVPRIYNRPEVVMIKLRPLD
ncbi:MAG: metallophosphoesterase [Erysipelotrichaceae bacterium]